MSKGLRRDETIAGILFVLPWILGLILFAAGPVIASFFFSFTDWNLLSPPKWIGLGNYTKLFYEDPLVRKSLSVSFIYTIISVPLGLSLALLLAIGLNRPCPGRYILRTIYYLPSVISGVAVAMLWQWIYNPEFGLANSLLRSLSLPAPGWLTSEFWALPALILMSLWGLGGAMVIYLAALQTIPTQLYEAALIDGAGPWNTFLNVTVPMISPVLFFTLIMGIIGSFQVFTQAAIMTNGGPANSTLMYVLYIYRNAFEWLQMGYASALAWVFFMLVLCLTLINFILAKYWVYYED
jgi:multiple sugar transport system permease protein